MTARSLATVVLLVVALVVLVPSHGVRAVRVREKTIVVDATSAAAAAAAAAAASSSSSSSSTSSSSVSPLPGCNVTELALLPLPLSLAALVDGDAPRAQLCSTASVVFTSLGVGSSTLDAAFVRYASRTFPRFANTSAAGNGAPSLTLNVSVTLAQRDTGVPQFGDDESYSIDVHTASPSPSPSALVAAVHVNATNVWGALHALETLTQLVVPTFSPHSVVHTGYTVHCGGVRIVDRPRFAWRAFMVDTARHFLPLSSLRALVDAMHAAKLNTLHWHLVDTQTFAYETSDVRSQRLSLATFVASARYSREQVRAFVAFAASRGVRVLPEFDTPGHALSWGVGYPQLLAACPRLSTPNEANQALNPTVDQLYTVLGGLYSDVLVDFADAFVHTGGDEVVHSCWTDDPSIVAWMRAHNVSTTLALEQYFDNGLVAAIGAAALSAGRAAPPRRVVWQDVLDYGVHIAQDTVVAVWRSPASMLESLRAGHTTLALWPWYLDRAAPVGPTPPYAFFQTWRSMYLVDPTDIPGATPAQLRLVVGGGAAQWAEAIDALDQAQYAWPRAAAVAERLWSAADVRDVSSAQARLQHFSCRQLVRRGTPATPIEPGFCVGVDGNVY